MGGLKHRRDIICITFPQDHASCRIDKKLQKGKIKSRVTGGRGLGQIRGDGGLDEGERGGNG